MAALDAPIEWLEASRVVVPLAERISAPGVDVAEREFVVVRAAAGGEVGWGFGLTRGALLDDTVMRHLAPLVIGRPAGSIRAIWDTARRSVAMLGECGIFARSLSLVDLALWDLQGKLLAAPLWRLLGGSTHRVPCRAIMGYYRRDDPVGVVRREAERLVAAGYRTFKIPIGLDVALDCQRLAAFRETAGGDVGLAVDAAGALGSIKDALAAWRWLGAVQRRIPGRPLPCDGVAAGGAPGAGGSVQSGVRRVGRCARKPWPPCGRQRCGHPPAGRYCAPRRDRIHDVCQHGAREPLRRLPPLLPRPARAACSRAWGHRNRGIAAGSRHCGLPTVARCHNRPSLAGRGR